MAFDSRICRAGTKVSSLANSAERVFVQTGRTGTRVQFKQNSARGVVYQRGLDAAAHHAVEELQYVERKHHQVAGQAEKPAAS